MNPVEENGSNQHHSTAQNNDVESFWQANGGQYNNPNGGQYGNPNGGQYGNANGGQYGNVNGGQYGNANGGQYGNANGGQYGDGSRLSYGDANQGQHQKANNLMVHGENLETQNDSKKEYPEPLTFCRWITEKPKLCFGK